MSLHQLLAEAGLAPRAATISTCFLADGSAHDGLLARMEFHEAPHRSLWRLEGKHELERFAPYLFQVQPASPLDNWLSSIIEELPLTVMCSSLSFDPLWRHLRHFSKFHHDNRHYLLRLGDPASFHAYLASLSQQPEKVARFFDHGLIDQCYFHDPRIQLARSVRPLFEQPLNSASRDGCLIEKTTTLKDKS